MQKKYNHKAVEKKWQAFWNKTKIFKANEDANKPKQYILDMFPYPSGAGLHVGHPKGYIATDVVSRMRMMQGYNVLHPMGWDAFGLPAENYAIKNKVHPSVATAKNVQTFKKQLGLLGFTYDWSREINTTDPNYYKWTQWIFLQMFKRGLAYESNEPINWCPSCKTGLANEDLEDGKCERCGSVVEQKPLRQWVLKITDYAERLLNDLDLLDKWPEPIKEMQRNWIGRSEGALVTFPLLAKERGRGEVVLEVFTTRPDTLFGATYVVVAPEHFLIANSSEFIANSGEVKEYIEKAKNKTALERTELQKEKTGVELKGIKAINPANNEELPIFVADYVLGNYGTGAIMAVPAHDERDFEFAKKYNLPVRFVVEPVLKQTHGSSAFKDQQQYVDSYGIIAIVKHWSEDKYLGLRWKNASDWGTLLTGGIDEGITPEETVKKEIMEETGYKNAKIVRKLCDIHSKYFHVPKNLNRFGHAPTFYVELLNDERVEISDEEKSKHELLWLTTEEMKKFLSATSHQEAIKIFESGCYTGTGLLCNSGQFNGVDSVEAKKKITEFVGGKMMTQYKLRDWVFSRQRYWGEPIPLVHCEKCAGKKPKILYIHGIYGDGQENWVPWFRKEMESRGYEVLTPDLPNNVHPTMEEWLGALSKLDIKDTDRLFIVGHSLGCPVACQFVLKRGAKVEKLILVGPTGKSQGEVNWENLRKAGCDEESLNCIRKFNSANKNLDKVKKLVGETVIYLSDNDPYIPMTVKSDYKSIGAKVIVLKNKGHFNKSAGVLEFQDVLKDFPAVRRQKALLIHGFTGRADKNWMPFMKKKLEETGFEVFVPTMTTTDHPVLEKWMDELTPIVKDFGENDVIVGHSLGGNAALHLLERFNKKIKHLFLVAPAVGELIDEDIQKKILKKPEKDYWSTKNFWNAKIYWNKIIDKVETATVIYSDNDESVKSYGYEFWPQDWEIRHPGAFGHFTDQGYSVLFDIIKTSRANGWVPVPEGELPLELPKVKHYEPSGTGESPLANIDKWVKTKCPVCGGPAKRETNTMPQWAGSCWYYLAYCMKHENIKALKHKNKYEWDKERINYWNPVDLYVGGAEHATRHLIYARFWHKFLYDIGAVGNTEPFTRLQNVGLILAEDGRKMSKRWGNVINPDDVVREYGADAMRLYEMFMGPFDQPCAWSMQGLVGMRRFLDKVWNLKTSVIARRPKADEAIQEANGSPRRFAPRDDVTALLHQTIKKVTDDIEGLRFNTAISQLMTLVNEMTKSENLELKAYSLLLQLLSPFAPHITEELWSQLGNKTSITKAEWPKYDPELAKEDKITIAVQINGKLRDTFEVPAEIGEEEVKKIALASEKVQKWLEGKEPKKVIYVRGKLVSIVV